MKPRRSSVICLGALLAAGTAVVFRPHSPGNATPTTPAASARAKAQAEQVNPAADPVSGAVAAVQEVAADVANVEPARDFGAWATEKPREPDFAKLDAFDAWKVKWKNATPEERQALVEEGSRLAGERRPEYRALISFDPRQAVDRAVTRVERQDLPKEIVSQLETPVSTVGSFEVYKGRPQPGVEIPAEALTMRYFEANGVSYKAHVPEELKDLSSLPNTPLQGYADGREFAVASNAVRALDVGEKIPAGATVQETCPVSGKTTESVSTGAAVTQDTPTVQIGETIITLCNGSHVAVLEDNYRTYVQASGSGGGGFFMDNYPGTSSRSIGAFKCLYIRVIYQEQTSPPNTEEGAYNDMRNNARYYIESSYGKMTQTTTFTPLVTLPHTQKWYIDKDSEVNGLGLVHNDSRAAAKALGYDPGQFDCIIVRVNGGPRLGGASWGGGSSVWVSWDGMDVLNHECGHSLGLSHANYWSTTDGTAYGTGANQEYGNPYDVMGGSGGFSAHYNTISKRQLGWLPSNYFHSPKTSGLYRIYAYDQPQLEEGKRYAINVAKDSIRGYNIEYHPARGGLLADQALVLYNGMGSNAGHLVDTTPGTPSGKSDAGIAEGRTYSDWESDQHFTVVAENATTPPSLDVVYNRGPFPGNVAPTATLGASATTISAGGSVTFTATASDANGDPLAYFWQFDDGVYGTNTSTFTRTFSTAAQVNAMLTVSDMKGGSVRRSVVINVGSHGKQAITGTVTDGTNPLAGVMIGNGSKYAFTNADGTYSLPGLATGSTTLTASLPGYTFTPSTANPYTVVAGTNTVNWTSAVPTLVTLTKTADPTEGGSNGNFRLTRTGDTSADLVVLVSPVGGTATMTTDYTFTPAYVASGSYKSFTIPAGSATLDVAVAAVNDTAAEGPETITLQLASSAGYVSGSSNSVVMTLNDNDTTLPLVAVTAPDPYATEAPSSTDTGKFTFTRTGSTAAALNVTVAWSGAATNGTDCTTLPTTVTIPTGQSSVDVVVTPTNDSLIEVPEDVVATISTNAAYLRDASATTASVIITDDDTPVVTVSVPDPDASEGSQDTGTFLLTRTGDTSAPLTVYYGLTGTASYGTDYMALTGQVTIPAGATSAPVVITPYDDDIGEPAETVVLSLSTFNNAYSIGSAYQGTVTITDNNDPVLVTVRAGSIGTEGGSNATLIFHTIGTGSGNVTVNYTVGGTATAGSDYTALSGSVSVPVNGSNDTTVTIPITNDTTAEPTETVVATITPGTGYKVYNDPSATALIRDNDSGSERVMVSTYNQTPSESGPTTANFYFSRAVGTTGALTVNYTMSGTATNGTDYATMSGTCVIADGDSGVLVPVTPVDDALVEGTETVTATVAAGTGYSVDFPASATFEITDNDAATVTVGFQQTAISTSEQPGALGEYRDLPVVLSASSANTITVRVIANGGDAMGDDVDWGFVDAANGNAPIPYATLTFAPGTTSKNVRIRVKNDGYVEGGETAVLQLTAATNASITANKGTESVLIFDDQIPALVTEERWNTGSVYTNNTWNSVTPDYTGLLESFTPAQDVADSYSRRLTGLITAPTTGTYTFWVASDDASRLYLSTDATAANKVQIATVSGWTNFQDWDANTSQKSANITLTAGQSYYMEVQHQEGGGGDHVSVAWQGPGFSRTPIVSPIADTAPRTVRMLTASTTRVEGDGSEPMLQVLLDRPAGSTPITVNYSSTGTATNGSDYSLTNGTLTFNSGEQMKALPLSILTDAIGEAPEGIVVSLSSPSGASLTAPSSTTITLLDANAPVVGATQVNATSAMSVGTVLGTATATPASGRSITGWTIVAGNESNLFAINSSGQVTLQVPGSLPNPGVRHLIVRAIDNAGSTGDGSFKVVCNPPAVAGVSEKRFAGATAYNTNTWTGTTNYTGSLTTFTTPQNVADSYSRQLTGYIQVPTTGDYTFWIASDDDSRLYLSTDETAANKAQIANVSGYTGFQSWDSQSSQKSATFTLTAGKVYYMEVQHYEGGGGDHASVAWQGPGISRAAIPTTAIFPQFLAAPVVPSVNVGAPADGSSLTSGTSVTVSANVVAVGLPVTSVEFYVDGSLVGSDGSSPYSINWTNNATVGSHSFTAKAVYSGGSVTSIASSFTVPNAAPTFTANPISGSNATEDSAYSGSIASYGADINPGDTLTFSKVSGPAWLSVASNGGLSGTPGNSDVGANAFTVKVTDAAGANVNAALNITVINVNDAPTFTANPITGAGATEDSAYSGSIASYGSDIDAGDTLTFSKVSGPSWLSVASNGALSGTPLNGDVGANAFTVKVTDAAGANVNATLNIAVANVNDAPVFTANPITGGNATEDSAYSGSIASYGTDVDAGDSLTFSKVSGPAWLSVASNGALSGTPGNSDVGANGFTVKVTDAAGANVNATLNITVVNVNDAPTFASALTAPDATSGMPYTGNTIAGSASDIDAGDTLTYTKVSGPAWLTVASNGALSGTPGLADGGSANVFTVRATDGTGAYAETTLTINVIIPDLAADPDGDGSPTGLEFTVGTAPFDNASVPGSIYTNLRGWWKLDETSGTNADDATGRVQDGTLAGSPASTAGIVGNALNLDGTDDGITLGNAPSLSGTGDFTVGAWVKIASGSGTGVIIQQRDATGSGYNGEYGLQVLSNGTVEFYIYNGGYQFDITTPTTYGLVNDNQWHYVAATRSGTTGTVYVDGNPLATASGTAKSLVSTLTMSIGWDQRDNNKRFKGLLDEVRLYTRALSASELNGIHDGLIANRAPAFTAGSYTLTNATVGSTYAGTLVGKATDADTDVLTFAKVSGPSWLTVASNGTLSGTPAAGDAGTGSYSVSVTDPDGQSATASLSVTVYGALPSGWTAGDIGSTGVVGSSGYTSGTGLYTISGAGADIWGTADAFQYASTSMTGDGEIRARVTSQTNTGGWAKAGVMMRDTTAAGSAHAMMVVTPSNGFANQYRATTGASSSHIAGPALNAYPNNWVRVTRCGSLFTTYVSSNGTTWTQVGQETVTMGSTIRVGLAVDSTSTTTASTATFDNVTVTPYPSPWVTGDIGTTGVAGRSEFFNNVHTLNGAGVVGGTADGLRYTYQALTADGDITVRIPSFANTGTSSRIGVMIRDTLSANSAHVFLGTDGSGAFTWTYRTTAGGSTTTANSGTATAPNVWVRLTRVGNVITAYSSTNGTSWTTVGSQTVTMASNCYIGVAVGSGNTTGLNASTFDNITVTP
ncbi:Calx-beta domain-containing protein [Luteolibacter sp. LG18]|uniref:Calx-beta domain-containing protein n=1 Tax=Luteolibacter sp. LG18 TaxID=2819286 RepID=UPI0030C6FB4E